MQIPTLKILPILALLIASCTANAAKHVPRPLALTWIFAIHDNPQGEPRGKVYLRLHNTRLLVETDARLHYQPLSRDEYSSHHIPTSALTACFGWFAGGGEDMYVLRRKNKLQIYRHWIEEHEPIPPYRLFRTLPSARAGIHATHSVPYLRLKPPSRETKTPATMRSSITPIMPLTEATLMG